MAHIGSKTHLWRLYTREKHTGDVCKDNPRSSRGYSRGKPSPAKGVGDYHIHETNAQQKMPCVTALIRKDIEYLSTVTAKTSNTVWYTVISVNGRELHFKIDTGAAVSAISKEDYVQIGSP